MPQSTENRRCDEEYSNYDRQREEGLGFSTFRQWAAAGGGGGVMIYFVFLCSQQGNHGVGFFGVYRSVCLEPCILHLDWAEDTLP